MRQNDTNNSRSLSEKQLVALPFLLTTHSWTDAAKAAEVSRSTLYRWMEEDTFRQELKRLRNEALELTHSEMKGLMFKATLVLGMAMDDLNPTVRLRAAFIALNMGIKLTEIEDLQQRLDHIEDALKLWRKKRSPC